MRRLTAGVAVAMLFTLAAAAAQDVEEKVPLDKVPKPVLDTVKARFKDGKLTGATREKEKDKWVFEVSLTEKGKDKNVDVTLTPEGELLTIEKEIDAKDLPKAAVKAIEDKYPKPTYKIAEEIFKVEKAKETLEYYEVLLVTRDKKKTMEVQVTAAGKIVAEEEKKGDEKDR